MTGAELKMFTIEGNKESKIKLIEHNFRNLTELEKEIIFEEDIMCVAYQDTQSVWTLGVGHTGNIKKGEACSIERALAWLGEDIETATKDCYKLFPNFDYFSHIRQNALISMAYNLGYPRFSKFKKTIALINQGKWSQASIEALDSKWHRQVWNRSLNIAKKLVEECKTEEV
jgi:lysozyme